MWLHFVPSFRDTRFALCSHSLAFLVAYLCHGERVHSFALKVSSIRYVEVRSPRKLRVIMIRRLCLPLLRILVSQVACVERIMSLQD